ncbi:hypothetical protein [Phenylobacterium deserti]|uniref:Uncharacterized protein n=1 Tax=Phenylobacterium deserti TaxID=1914756 RepID=A0A328AA86_9CAUL|nr:hypothetical protein [Phenylobacterium deserti]RAK51465.1 hypothetical protein DJ018_16145 [Phenylobacterium deserti]
MKRALVIAAAIWVAALPAAAQDVWGWSVIIPSVTGTDQLGTVLRNQQSSRTPPAPARAPAALRFTPSP